MYVLCAQTMRLVLRSCSLSLRPFALARLPSRLCLPTNTTSSRTSTLYLTTNDYRLLSTMPGPPPPAKRKWPRRNGGAANGGPTPTTPTTPRSTVAQQPKRPKVEDTLPKPVGTIDVKQMYGTAAGGEAPRPFSDLKDKLNKGLLDGLEKMGFE